jgi:hypothetical protein
VRVTHVASLNKNDEDSLDFSFLLNSLSDQHDASMNTNEIAASVTFHCPTASTNEITGSVVMRQASFRIDHPACENGNYLTKNNLPISIPCNHINKKKEKKSCAH